MADHLGTSVPSSTYLMAELNPSDGSMERVFQMDNGSFFNIACEVDG